MADRLTEEERAEVYEWAIETRKHFNSLPAYPPMRELLVEKAARFLFELQDEVGLLREAGNHDVADLIAARDAAFEQRDAALDLLNATAIEVQGAPGVDVVHDLSELPSRVKALRIERDALEERIREALEILQAHEKSDRYHSPWCGTCWERWPCDIAAARMALTEGVTP